MDKAFKKRLFLCILLQIVILATALYTNKKLDVHNDYISSIVNHGGKQRYISQRIAYITAGLIHAQTQEDLNHYHALFDTALETYKKNIIELDIFYNSVPDLKEKLLLYKQKIHPVFNETPLDIAKNYHTYLTHVHEHLHKDTFPISSHTLSDIKNINDLSLNKILTIFDENIDTQIHYIKERLELTRQIKNATLFVFFISIIGTIFIIFYPLQRRINRMYLESMLFNDQLNEEKKRTNLALKRTSTGIWDWDVRTNNFHCNETLRDILGIDKKDYDQLDVNHFRKRLHPNDAQSFRNKIEKHLNTGAPFDYEGQIQHSDGHYIYMMFSGQALWDETGKAYRMLGSCQDIGEKKEVEIFSNIFVQGIETANIAFAIIDLHSKQYQFKYASPAFCEMTEYSLDKITSSNMSMFLGPETSMSDLDKIDYAIINHKELSLKMLCYKKSGVSFWNNVLLRPIFNDGIFSNYFIAIFDDLTESINQQGFEVERQRNESLGSLAGSVAHEINNLLMPMTMLKDLIEDELKEDCDPFAREQLDTVDEFANQAKEIVQGILTFSRKETTDTKKAILQDEISRALNFITSLLSAKTTVNFHNNHDEDLVVMINSTEMKQIITNMCKNAEHAFDGNAGQVDITLSKEIIDSHQQRELDVTAKEFALITITDNGSGIPSEHLKKIFEPLFTTKPVGEGTGLGLSVVIGIIRSWGGNIQVDSVIGSGTTFRIYIPIYKNLDDFSDLIDIIEDLNN